MPLRTPQTEAQTSNAPTKPRPGASGQSREQTSALSRWRRTSRRNRSTAAAYSASSYGSPTLATSSATTRVWLRANGSLVVWGVVGRVLSKATRRHGPPRVACNRQMESAQCSETTHRTRAQGRQHVGFESPSMSRASAVQSPWLHAPVSPTNTKPSRSRAMANATSGTMLVLQLAP